MALGTRSLRRRIHTCCLFTTILGWCLGIVTLGRRWCRANALARCLRFTARCCSLAAATWWTWCLSVTARGRCLSGALGATALVRSLGATPCRTWCLGVTVRGRSRSLVGALAVTALVRSLGATKLDSDDATKQYGQSKSKHEAADVGPTRPGFRHSSNVKQYAGHFLTF